MKQIFNKGGAKECEYPYEVLKKASYDYKLMDFVFQKNSNGTPNERYSFLTNLGIKMISEDYEKFTDEELIKKFSDNELSIKANQTILDLARFFRGNDHITFKNKFCKKVN